MASDVLEILLREEAATGFPARRASILLFAIENRAAHLRQQAQRETAIYRTTAAPAPPEVAAAPSSDALLEALAHGRETLVQPTVQDLEHYAPQWASLVPPDANARAAITRLVSEKYLFTHDSVPALRRALGWDSAPVQQAYQSLYDQPLATIYAPTISALDHLRWAWARLNRRLENLPPFWVAFMLTLPGAPGLLALPIVLASLGPLAGIALVILFGMINMVTVAALAEAVARSGTARFGLGFLGQLVDEYLGSAGSVLLTAAMAVNNFLVLIIFYLGVAGTLESSTRVPAEIWVAALFAVCLYFLSRRSFNSTVSSTLLIVFVNLIAIVIIPLLALPYFQSANLLNGSASILPGPSFNPAALGAVVGVMLSTYFSHFLVASYGPVVLRRDPSARSWIGGSVAAIFVFMLIALLWMVTMNGAIPGETLARTTGTVLEPLATKIGAGVLLIGSVLVILSLGLASIQVSLGLYYLIQERLPAPRASMSAASERRRFLFSISPVVVAFLLTQWLTLTGAGSFASLLGTVSALALPLLGGIFPVLLLAATRRKGDFAPTVVFRWLGSPVVIAGTYLFFWGSILVHGLVIWQEPWLRAVALVTGLIVLGMTLLILRRGALEPRVVIELRQDRRLGGQDEFNVTARGEPAAAAVKLEYASDAQQSTAFTGRVPAFAALRAASFALPATNAQQLKVWAHQITPEGASRGLPVVVEVDAGNGKHATDLALSNGAIILPISGAACTVRLVFP